jgi:single-strand DNA-binding protein
MAKSVNKVILLGHVGKDPEVGSTTGGTTAANFSLATSERYKDRSGEWQDRTEWHNLVAYARGAEIVRDYVKKGAKLYVEGRITTHSWDDKDSGKKMYRTEIVVGDITLLTPSENGNAHSGGKDTAEQRSARSGRSNSHRDQAADDYGDLGITDQDVPF